MQDINYSLDYLKSISGGDEEFVKEMIQTFITNVPNELISLHNLITQKNWSKVGAESHRFASNLVFLELTSLRSIAIQIEDIGSKQTQTDQIPELFEQLEKGCLLIITKLKKDFNY